MDGRSTGAARRSRRIRQGRNLVTAEARPTRPASSGARRPACSSSTPDRLARRHDRDHRDRDQRLRHQPVPPRVLGRDISRSGRPARSRDNFTRHPSEYIPGYPKDATRCRSRSARATSRPDEDRCDLVGDQPNGHERRALLDPRHQDHRRGRPSDAQRAATCRRDPHPILDDDGHGSGSASCATGNRYGYCPTCLLVIVEALDEPRSSAPLLVGRHQLEQFRVRRRTPRSVSAARIRRATRRAAVERGQTVLFAAGNGVGNAFECPIATYGSDADRSRLEHHRRRDPARQPARHRRRWHPRHISPRGATATCRRPAAPAPSRSAPSAAHRPRRRTPPASSAPC